MSRRWAWFEGALSLLILGSNLGLGSGSAWGAHAVDGPQGVAIDRLVGSEPAVYAEHYQMALGYLESHLRRRQEWSASGRLACVAADADAAVALAEDGDRLPALQLSQGLQHRNLHRPKNLAAALWAVSTVDVLCGQPDADRLWTRRATSQLWQMLQQPRQLPVALLSVSDGALRAVLADAGASHRWFYAWRLDLKQQALSAVVTHRVSRPNDFRRTVDYLAGCQWQALPKPLAQRILVGLTHLGMVEAGVGLRLHVSPQGSGYDASTAATFALVQALSRNGLGALATTIYNQQINALAPSGGVYSVIEPAMNAGQVSPVGSISIAATASYALATRAIWSRQQYGLGWRRARLRSTLSGRSHWVSGHDWFDPSVGANFAPVALCLHGLSDASVVASAMMVIEHGGNPTLFWDRPWPGLPSRLTAALALNPDAYGRVLTVRVDGGDRARYRVDLSRLAKMHFNPARPADAVGLAADWALERAIARDFALEADGHAQWRERYTPSLGDSAPSAAAYLWPLSQWVAAQESLAVNSGRPRGLGRILAAMAPYVDSESDPVGFTAAIDDSGGREFFDDNGWVLLDDLDAYAGDQNSQWLAAAEREFQFMTAGWSGQQIGGEWFNTKHLARTESATGTFLIAAERLYRITHQPRYGAWAHVIGAWNRHHMVTSSGLYGDSLYGEGQRAQPENSALPYDTGLAIDADVSAYHRSHQSSFIEDARYRASVALAAYEDPLTDVIVQSSTINAGQQDAMDAIFLDSVRRLYQVVPELQYRRALEAEANWVAQAVQPSGLVAPDWGFGMAPATTGYSLLAEASALRIWCDAYDLPARSHRHQV